MARTRRRSRSRINAQTRASRSSVRAWQLREIKLGVADLEAGRSVPHEEVKRRLLEWRNDSAGVRAFAALKRLRPRRRAFDRILDRKGTEPPREGDELPKNER
jgi:predicted transcriptional regulator